MVGPDIKICGISTPDALEAAIRGRARFVGFNFYPPSPRFVTPADAAKLATRADGRIASVGVFVDADDAFLGEHVAPARLSAIQLHGSESPQRAAQIAARFGLPVWKALAVTTAADIARADSYRGAADFILFDAKTPKGGLPGGMGLSFDWSLLAGLRPTFAWGLAGGLTPDNVAAAMQATGAPLLDTSSGVESAPGIKDADRIAAFCRAVRGE